MKTRLLMVLIVLMTLTSCYNNVEKVTNPKELTTLKIQELPKDTVIISIDANNLYVFNDAGEVKYHMNNNTEGKNTPISKLYIIVSVFLILGIIAATVAAFKN